MTLVFSRDSSSGVRTRDLSMRCQLALLLSILGVFAGLVSMIIKQIRKDKASLPYLPLRVVCAK